MPELLEIKNLSKNFHGLKAVSDVSFTVEKGSITGMIGSNGAGKTTVFNMISGVLTPSSGSIIYQGKDITGTKACKYTGMGIARTFQIMKPLRNMTVLDNVVSGAILEENILELQKQEIMQQRFWNLQDYMTKRIFIRRIWVLPIRNVWK